VKANLDSSRANWYRLHSGTLDPDFDINESITASGDLVQETRKKVEVWTAASQTTLISSLPDSSLNATKNVELARSVAQETLETINQIEAGIDDLSLVQEILASDTVRTQGGFKSFWTRLTLISDNVGSGFFSALDFDLFHIGDAPVTPGGIIKMLLIVMFGYLLSWTIRHLLERLQNRRKYAKSSAVYTLGRILHYIIIITSIFAALGTIGLDFTNFALIAGALSVGIGFGLQSIVNNFVSGLILLFEGSLRVGDYIELDNGLRGTVKEINTRATVINTNDSVDMVVPNSEFVTARLTNWTLRDPVGRLRVDFGVAYGSDKDLVKEAALEAASEVDAILQHTPGREAQVRLVKFGDSSLDFQVLVWVSKLGLRRPGRTKAEFMWILETKLRERGIEIPFPQRDLHLRTGFSREIVEEVPENETGQ
jgi:small-conductance mechanosensitive channel